MLNNIEDIIFEVASPSQVVIGPDISLKPRAKITLKQKEEEDDFGMDELSLQDKEESKKDSGFNPAEVGSEGQGYVWLDDSDSMSDDEDQVQDIWGN